MKSKIGISFLLFFLCVGIVVVGSWEYLQFPVDLSKKQSTSFTIPKSDPVPMIGVQLQSAGLIRSAFMFRFLISLENTGSKIQTGTFDLSSSMSLQETINTLMKPAKDNWVTLLEGWRMEEIAAKLASRLDPSTFDVAKFELLAKDSEGMLFPDTYLIPNKISAQTVLSLLRNNFDKKYNNLVATIGQSDLTKEQVIILASIVQREANKPADMQVVAGILRNRLRMNMPLQVDATVQYALGYDSATKNWWKPLKAQDTTLVSPFNTYVNTGFPPSPIGNPGEDALRAALHPQQSDYLFYITDHRGIFHYASTLAQHDAFIQQYLR